MSIPTLTVTDGRATIALQRPDKRNRIEPPDLTAIIEHCDAIEGDDSVRVVVLESTGPSWCSGYHLGALADGEHGQHSFSDLCTRVESLRVPIIAKLHGNVHGGGTDLAIACDFRIAADHIVLAMPAAKIGLQYYTSGLRRFVDRVGPDATKRLFLTAETISAEELLRIGYCTELVATDALDARVDELADAIAALAPNAVANTKAAIDALASGDADFDELEVGHIASARSDEHRDAMAALKAAKR